VATSSDLAGILRTVLLVVRLGEADRRGWWGTQSFGAAGRVVLKQRLPRTWRMAAVELDIAAATNRHNEVIDRPNAVHLFSDNWPVRRWASSWVAEQKTADPAADVFEELETVSQDALLSELGASGWEANGEAAAVRVGDVREADLESPDSLGPLVARLGAVYAGADRFVVPYLEVVR